MSELDRIERLLREVLGELRVARELQGAILARQDEIIVLLQPSTDYPASTGATITVK